MNVKNIYNSVVRGIKEKIDFSGLNGIVNGFSGGIDSAVSGALAIQAIGKNKVHGLLMPFYKDEHFSDAMDVVHVFGIDYHVIWINGIYDAYYSTGILWKNITKENLMPRIRNDLSRSYANEHNVLVISNMNQAEEFVGYGTKGGDIDGDYYPLRKFPKCLVRDMACYINDLHEKGDIDIFIPDQIITKAPSAGLTPGQTDEGDLGITYDDLDRIAAFITHDIPISGVPERAINRFYELRRKSAHKRIHTESPFISHNDLMPDFGSDD